MKRNVSECNHCVLKLCVQLVHFDDLFMMLCFCIVDKNAMTAEKSIKVEVKRLDHGDTACLSLQNITDISPEMTALPLQALHVSLANVSI